MEIKTGSDRVTVALETLGCKLNQAETELLARQLVQTGCKIVRPDEKADIYILNTCTVTHIADRKSRHLLRMARRQNPSAQIIALGCYAEREPDALARIEGVDLVVGNEDKAHLGQLLEKHGYLKSTGSGVGSDLHNRTRSFIKMQDGCNNFCTYCIVPLVRGREKCLPPEQVMGEIRQRILDGYQEVVLTGTEIGCYSAADLDLKGLLKYILAETEITRLRLSSLQPQEINAEFIRLWQDSRLCRHFHISLQSGSDTVLRRMNRPYSTADYARTVDLIRCELPEASITTDIMVGFPAESQKEFQESYDFCSQMEFARIHVFPYSPRKGTQAAQMSGQIGPELKKPRTEKMLALAREAQGNFYHRFLDQTEMVLFEQPSGGLWSGLTDNYIKVYVKTRDDLTNQMRFVKLVELRGDGIRGTLL